MIQQLGPYRIESVLGRGGMGTVYVGVHQANGQRVAVKVLAPGLAVDEGFRARFAAEIETLKKLKHSHIVDLYGYGEEDGHLFYAMQLVEASSLHEELAAGRRFEWREVNRIGIQVCGALKHAHDHGVIHRDLKPANLLLDADDQIHLTDFGIAKFFGQTSLTMAGGVLGTADYMSPEQAEGRGTTVRSDLYSLGSVLYALLAGRPPFCGKSLPEVVHMVRFDRPLPVRRFAPGVPAEFESILEQLLRKEPQERIPTALALSHRLRAMEQALTLHPGGDDQDELRPHPENDVGPDELDRAPPSDEQHETLSGTVADLRERFDESVANRDTMSVPLEIVPPSADSLDVDSDSLTDPGPSGAVDPCSENEATRTAGDVAGHFTEIDELQRKEALESLYTPANSGTAWWKIALAILLLVLVGVSVWYSRRPWTADQLYRRIQANANSDDGRHLTHAEQDIRQFLERFAADGRRDALTALREQIELTQLDQKLQRRAWLSRAESQDLSPVEQLYVEAIRTRQISPEATATRLEAMIELFGGHPHESSESQRCVLLAERELEVLRASIELASAPHLEFIESRLDAARQLQQDDPASAQAIWRGLIHLYSDRPWAAALIQQARESLARSGNPENGER